MSLVVALVKFLMLAALLMAVLSYSLFLTSARNRSHPLFLAACGGHRTACLLRALVSSFLSLFCMFVTIPLGLWPLRRPPQPFRPGEPVVVCLHGLYHNASAFLAIRPALRRAGCPHVLALTYASFGASFETVAGNVLAELRRQVPPDCPLVLVGHSLGGLLARELAAAPDVAGRVRAVVTLGSPHRGSRLAVLALGRLGRSLTPGHPLFAHLDALPDPPSAVLTALVSPVDNMVLPLDGLILPRPSWTMEATVPVSHVALLYHPAVVARVAALVAAGLDG